MNNKIILPAFILMVLAQLYVPASMIFEREKILTSGKEYRFKTAPVDPNDPFRGKYITLSFESVSLQVPQAVEWNYGENIFVELTTDTMGFANILNITKEKPLHTSDYVTATISFVNSDSVSMVHVLYPFDRFYMEETKAPLAEQAYNEAAIDSNQVTYALVMIRNGEAVIKDVIINGESVKDIVEKQQTSPQ